MSSSQNFHSDGTLFIVSGPSGAGKTTLIKDVREDLAAMGIRLHFSVSHTTRAPRLGELDGVSYHFVTPGHFHDMVEHGEFIEWAHVHEQLYGTSKAEVLTRLRRNEDVILDIDYQGALQIASDPDLGDKSRSSNIFIFPPSLDELERRLRARALNTDAEIDTRLQKALAEIDAGKDIYDYVIINDDLDVAAECLKAVIIAKKLHTKRALEAIGKMAERFKEEHDGRTPRGH